MNQTRGKNKAGKGSRESLYERQAGDLALLRNLIQVALGKLQKAASHPEELKEIFGAKEDFLSVLTKLSQLQVKLIPLEQELMAKTAEASGLKAGNQNNMQEITDAELAALAKAIDRKLSVAKC